MAIGQSNKPNFNVQTPVANQSLVYDNAQQAFVNANISSSGSVTGASNVGSGSGVFKQLSGSDLQFRSLVAGTNISLAQSTDSVTITANGVVTTAENLGSGTGLFAQLNSGTGKVQFKGLVAGTGIALANNSTDVTVSINAASVDAATLGGNAASVFLTKADNLASIGSITTTRTNLSVYSKAEGDSRYFKQGADLLPDADNTRSLGSNSNRFSDVYAKDIHGTVTTAGQVTTISNHNIGGLGDVDTTGVTGNSILKWNGTKWAIAVDAGGITTLNALTDVDTTGAVNSSVLKYNASSNIWEVGSDIGGGGGASTFVGLTDTPNNFVGAGSKFVKVNSGSSALEYVTVDSDDIAEGSNLYYTNARADARIGAASLSALSNVHTAAPTNGQVLKWDNGNSRWAPANDTDTVYSTFNSDFDTRLGSKNTDNLSEGSSNLYYTDARWDNRLSAKSTTNLTEGSNLYYTDARVNARVSALGSANWNTAYGWGNHASAGYLTSVPAQSFASLTGKPTTIAGYGITNLNASIDTHLNQSNPTSGYVLSWNGSDYAWVSNAGGGAGDITAVVAGTGLTGGATSGSATLNVDVGTGANKIVQLDGSAKIPAVDGSLLTNINYTVGVDEIKDTMIDFGTSTGQVSTADIPESTNLYYTDGRFDTRLASKSTTNLSEGTNLYFTNARADARISAAGINALSDVDTTGIANDKILKYNSSSSKWVIADDSTGGGGSANFTGLSDTPANFSGGANKFVKVNAASNALEYVADPGYLTSVPAQSFASLTSKPTTIAGYGITDAYDDSDFDTRLASKNTANLTEGTNLYYTNARADARITNAGVTGAKVTNWDTAYGWGNHASAGYLTSVPAQSFASLTGKPTTIGGYGITDLNTLVDGHINQSNPTSGYVLSWNGSDYAWVAQSGGGLSDVVSDTTPQLGGDLDTLDKKVATSTGRLQLGGGFGAGGINDSGNTRTQNFGAYFNYTSDNSKRHYNSAWYNKQTLSANTSASNKKQGWLNNSTLDIAGYTHGVDDANNVNKYWGDFHWTHVTNSTGSNSTINGQIGLFVGSTIQDSSTSEVNATSIIGVRSYAGAEYAGGTVTNLIGLYTDTDKHGSATVTNRYSIYAPGANDKAYFAGQITTGAITLPNTDGTNGQVLQTNGSGVLSFATVSSGGSVAGSNTQVQFNDSGSFGADSGLTFNKSTDTLTAGAFTTSGSSPKLSSTAALTLESGSNNDITITPNGSGDIILDGQKWPQADGSTGQYLKTDGSGQLSWSSVTGGPADTDALSEGSSNLYHTTARAISAIQGTNINMGSNSITTTGKVLYSNVYSALVDLPSASTYHGMFAHVHATGKGYFAHGGNWIELANHSQLANSSNWDTAFGWGNHASAGYLTSVPAQTFASLTSKPTTLAGYGITDGYTDAKADLRITNAIKDEDNMASNSATHVPSQQSVKAYVDAQSGGTAYEEFKINYATNGTISSISDTTSNITSVNIDSAAGGDLTVNFQNFTTPPLSTMFYGYNYAANEYNMNTLGSTGTTLRKVPGGGSSGSPTAFGSFSNLKIRVSESETGASRSFGTATHAWVRFVMGA